MPLSSPTLWHTLAVHNQYDETLYLVHYTSTTSPYSHVFILYNQPPTQHINSCHGYVINIVYYATITSPQYRTHY